MRHRLPCCKTTIPLLLVALLTFAPRTAAQQLGVTIFTVDYALHADHIAAVYAQSCDSRFIPFAGPRSLDRFVPLVP